MSSAAHAASITNLTDKPFDLDVSLNGEPQQIAIEPGRTWESEANPILVKVGEKTVKLERDARYTIWKDGTLALQNRGEKIRNRD